MTTVPSGTFHMGQSDEDVPATHINYNKHCNINFPSYSYTNIEVKSINIINIFLIEC